MSTVPASPSPFVLALGGANLDIVATAQAFQAAESNPGRIRCAPGGVARNVAENLARLGHAVGLVTLFGDDAFGTALRAATAAAGVDLALAPVVAGAAGCSYLALHGADGDLATAVNDMAQALQNPFPLSTGMIRSTPHPLRPDFRSFANPIKLDGARLPTRTAPALGADTDAVLRELGYSDEEIGSLRARGIT